MRFHYSVNQFRESVKVNALKYSTGQDEFARVHRLIASRMIENYDARLSRRIFELKALKFTDSRSPVWLL